MPCTAGTAFEDYVWSGFWAREFPGSQGWTRESQKALLDGRFRPDFAAWRGNERAIGDAKDKAILTYDDVDKAIEDAGAFRATYCYLMIASDTLVSDRVREYATEQRVEIVTMRGWRAR